MNNDNTNSERLGSDGKPFRKAKTRLAVRQIRLEDDTVISCNRNLSMANPDDWSKLHRQVTWAINNGCYVEIMALADDKD